MNPKLFKVLYAIFLQQLNKWLGLIPYRNDSITHCNNPTKQHWDVCVDYMLNPAVCRDLIFWIKNEMIITSGERCSEGRVRRRSRDKMKGNWGDECWWVVPREDGIDFVCSCMFVYCLYVSLFYAILYVCVHVCSHTETVWHSPFPY